MKLTHIIVLGIFGAACILVLPVLLVLSGFPLDIPVFLKYGVLMRRADVPWHAFLWLFAVLGPIGTLSLWICFRKMGKYVKSVKRRKSSEL